MSVWIWKDPADEYITFQEFVQEYVCVQRQYSNQEVQQWLREYNLSMNSRVVFIRTGYFKDAVRMFDGYLLFKSGRSIQDKIIYLFVSNKKRI